MISFVISFVVPFYAARKAPAGSAPQCGEHRDDLFLSGHDARKEDVVVFRLDAEGEADGVVITDVEELGTFLKDIREHQDHEVIAALGAERIHMSDEFVFPVEHLERIDADDLRHAEGVLSDVEFLEVRLHQLLDGLRVEGSIEEVVSEFVDAYAGDTGETLSHRDIPLCAGRRLEHNRVGKDRSTHKAGHLRGRHDTVFLIKLRDDRIRAADGFIAHRDRLRGLDIRKTVMVDDTKDLRLFEPRHGLREFIVVHQYDLLSSRTQEVESRESSDDFVVLIEYGVASETAL